MSIAFVPLYIRAMGAENYGLVGIFLMLSSLANILDLGFSTTLNRELAQSRVNEFETSGLRNLLRTFELPYWCLGIGAASSLALASEVIAGRWLRPVGLTPSAVSTALQLMAVALAAQWPSGLYAGGLMGLERQVFLNIVLASFATARGIGSLVVLWWLSPTAEAFFIWQALVNGLQTLVLAIVLWRALPHCNGRPEFDLVLLHARWRYTAGLATIAILGAIMTQFDKLILSQLLTLDQFGYYSLAWLIANTLLYLVGPIGSAMFPRLARASSSSDHKLSVSLYHLACQAVSLIIIPVASIFFFFDHELLFIWTSNATLSALTAPVLSIMLIGTLLNAIVQIPFQMQFAAGETRLAVTINIVALILVVPITYFLTFRFGVIGAATGWVVLNLGYVIAAMPLVHRDALDGEAGNWFIFDVMRPLLACTAVTWAGVALMPELQMAGQLLYIAFVGVVGLCATTLTLPEIRNRIFYAFGEARRSHGS